MLIPCLMFFQVQALFQINHDEDAFEENAVNENKELREAAVLYPVRSSNQILQLHKLFTMKTLKRTFTKIRNLQTDIQKTIPFLPKGKYWLKFPNIKRQEVDRYCGSKEALNFESIWQSPCQRHNIKCLCFCSHILCCCWLIVEYYSITGLVFLCCRCARKKTPLASWFS